MCGSGDVARARQWGYRTLMLGWASYAVFIVAATWWVASLRTLPGAEGPPQALVRAAAKWVAASGILAVLLGLKAAIFHAAAEELLWAAAAIALAAIACAAMAVWRRSEGWAFAAAPGVNLAASLVVVYAQTGLFFRDWWVLLVQANIIASAAVALVWLAARKRLYELREFSVRSSPLLATQTSLGVVATGILFLPAVARMLFDPSEVPAPTAQLAEPAGWIALLAAVAAAAWYLRQVSPRDLVHVVAGAGLGIGVLLMGSALRWSAAVGRDPWFAYHVLESTWAVAGFLVLLAGILGRHLRIAGQFGRKGTGTFFGPGAETQRDNPTGRMSQSPVPTADGPAAEPVFPRLEVQGWVTAIGAAALGLALFHVHDDPMRPWWSAGVVVAVSLAAGLLATWLRLPAYVYVSGLLWNVAASVLWLAWDSSNPYTLVASNALALAIASSGWSVLRSLGVDGGGWHVPERSEERGLRPDHALRSSGRATLGGGILPFNHLAAAAATALLAGVAVTLVACDAKGIDHPTFHGLDGIALAAIAVAMTQLLWDGSARFVLPGLYAAGLTGLALELDARGLTGRGLAWTAAVELSVLVLGAALLAELLPRRASLWKSLGIPSNEGRWPADWLPTAQAFVASGSAILALWVSMDPAFDTIAYAGLAGLAGRLAGPAVSLLLLGAAVAMAGTCGSSQRWRAVWQHATMGLGLLVLSEFGWAVLDPKMPLPWLHGSVILMAAGVAMTLVAAFGVERIVGRSSDWVAHGTPFGARFRRSRAGNDCRSARSRGCSLRP